MKYKKSIFTSILAVSTLFSLAQVAQATNHYTSNCVAGTVNTTANQCLAYGGNGLQMVSFCTGNETSGPCRDERINPIAAANAAATLSQSTGQSCQAQFVSFPGVDPNTGLNYYYSVSCDSGGGGGGYSGSAVTGIGGGTTVQSVYVSSLMDLVRSMINQFPVTQPPSNQPALSQSTSSTNFSGQPTSFPVTLTVNVALLNVRSAPNTSATIVTQLSWGATFTATGVVTGSNVEGTNQWWVTSSNTYIWAGGTTW